MEPEQENLSFFKRLRLAFSLLSRPALAKLVQTALRSPALPQASAETTPTQAPAPAKVHSPTPSAELSAQRKAGALELLAILQREGRFLDFIEQDIAGFSDSDIGVAARVVHEGCKKALHTRAQIRPIYKEAEGSRIALGPEQDMRRINLIGNVNGDVSRSATLRHPGWLVTELSLPISIGNAEPEIVYPAELEL